MSHNRRTRLIRNSFLKTNDTEESTPEATKKMRPPGTASKREEGDTGVANVVPFPANPGGPKKTTPKTDPPPLSLFRWARRMKKPNRTMSLRLFTGGGGGSTADMSSTASTATTSPSLSPLPSVDRDNTLTPNTEEAPASPTKTFEKEWVQELVSIPSTTWCPRTATPPKPDGGNQSMASLLALPTLRHSQVSSKLSYRHEEEGEYVAPPYRYPASSNENSSDDSDGGYTNAISTTALDGHQGSINGRVGTVHDPNDYQDDPPLFVKVDPVKQQEKFPDDEDVSMSSLEKEAEQNLRDVFEEYEDVMMMPGANGNNKNKNDKGLRRHQHQRRQHQQHHYHQENSPQRAGSSESSSISMDDIKTHPSDDLSSSGSFGAYDGFSVLVPEVRDDSEERSNDGGGGIGMSFDRRGLLARSAEPSAYSFVGCDYSCSRAPDTDDDQHYFRETGLKVPGLLYFSTKSM